MPQLQATTDDLRTGLVAGGAPVLWQRVVGDALPAMSTRVPPGSRVLEVGYGDGRLTCFLARRLDWSVVGYDVSESAHRDASAFVISQGLEDRVRLHLGAPHRDGKPKEPYDAVFIKTVLYSSRDLEEYRAWLDWIAAVLRPGGYLVNFETGRANALTQAYRRLRGRPYADLSLYTAREESLYDERFDVCYRKYYGHISQFASPVPFLYRIVSRVEEAVFPPSADHCFVVSIIAAAPK